MRILVVGSGAREHALAWRLASEGAEVIVAPGNGGTPNSPPVATTDIPGLAELAKKRGVDLTIVGPEAPLAAGLIDAFVEQGLHAFGPTRAAARLEWSKAWAKDFLLRHDIPTGHASVVESKAEALRAVPEFGLPVVIKADGLAAGKGVWVAHTRQEIETALEALFERKVFGAAGERVLIEQWLDGPELSVMAFCDGERLAVMPPARDYKRLRDNDQGPNTGGMGGYTRPGYATLGVLEEVETAILRPTLEGMARAGVPYRGVLYAGLMLTHEGPKVLEFNCRFGDPEAQLVLPLLRGGLAEICQSVVAGRLDPRAVEWVPGATCGIVLASPGYPESPRLGDPILGLEHLPPEIVVFHAGTAVHNDQLVTSGGRVLTLVARGASLSHARAQVLDAVPIVRFEGVQYRRDIGLEAVYA